MALVLSIHYLRGLATLLVVAYHVYPQWQRLGGGSTPEWANYAGATIDVFFIISGFVIWVTTQGRRDDILDFLKRRLDRVVPFYWAITFFLVVTALIAPNLLPNTQLDLRHVLASFLFIPYPYPTSPDMIAPVLIPGWTLNYELPFYLVFGLCLALPQRGRLIAMWAITGGLSLLGLLIPAGNMALDFYTQPIVLNFAMGVTLGYAWCRGVRLPVWLSALLVVVGLTWLSAAGLEPLPRPLRWSIPACLIVVGLVFLEQAARVQGRHLPQITPLQLTADAAYSIYLTHALTLPVYTRLWSAGGMSLRDGFPLFALGAVAVSWCVGVSCYRVLEQRLRLTRPRKPVAAIAPIVNTQ